LVPGMGIANFEPVRFYLTTFSLVLVFSLGSCRENAHLPKLVPISESSKLKENQDQIKSPTLKLQLVTDLDDTDQLSSQWLVEADNPLVASNKRLEDIFSDRWALSLAGSIVIPMELSGDKFLSQSSTPSSTEEFNSIFESQAKIQDIELLNSYSTNTALLPASLIDFVNFESFADRIYARCDSPSPSLKWNKFSTGMISLKFTRKNPPMGFAGTHEIQNISDNGNWSFPSINLEDDLFKKLFSPEELLETALEDDVDLRIIRSVPIVSLNINQIVSFKINLQISVELNETITLVYEKDC